MPFDLNRIGQLLRDTREEKGLTLDEISKALLIKKSIMSAIESGDWGNLPPPVYVKGYVSQYAALLKIVDVLEAEIARPESPPAGEEEGLATKDRTPKRWTARKKIMAAAVLGAVAVGFFIFQNLPKTTTVAPPAQTVAGPNEGVETSPGTQATGTTPPSPQEQPAKASPPVAAEEVAKPALTSKKLTIACHERTWVRIIIDGSEEKEFMLKPEEVVVLEAKESFDLLIGNAGGVTLFYNGKDTGFSGKTGEVKHVRLP